MRTDSPKKHGMIYKFFRLLWQSLKAFNTVVLTLVSVLLIAALLYAFFSQKGTDIPTGAALVLNPAGALVEQKSAVDPAAFLQMSNLPQQTLVKDLTDALTLAKEDERIGLVVLKLDRLQHALLPKLEAIAAAIIDFKSSDKRVIAIADSYSQSALYLAAHADEVLLNPEGMGLPQGFAMYQPYFKSFLDKLDVTVNLFKVGKYKSAVDPYLRDTMSVEDREARTALLDTWWQTYTTTIESARGIAPGTLQTMLENAPEQIRLVEGSLARLSLDKGLVDRLVTDTERRAYLIGLAGEDSEKNDYRKIGYQAYLRVARPPAMLQDKRVAVITAVGLILDGHAPAGQIGSQSLNELIRKARLDNDIGAIVLRIDSGGGSKTASETIRSELQAARDSGIPVVVSMGSIAASGAYWIAAEADEIWASPTTITGSIGIYGLLPTFEKTLARFGINSDGIATTPIAGGASVTRGITPAYREILQTVIDAGYQQFLNTVADGRGMDIDAVHEVAQGRIWTGDKAYELGLVDELGELDEAIRAAARLADLADYSVWFVEPALSLEDKLLRKFTETMSRSFPTIRNNPLSRITTLVHRELGFLGSLNDPHHAYVICSECPLQQ
ncbi:MAG: signal peptide peptidase SppA [Granulosicoccus sp.]